MYALQTAIVQAVAASTPVKALIGNPARIYDALTSETPTLPYVTVGEFVTAPFDTKTSNGRTAEVALHVWSGYRGRKEAEDIMAAIYGVLHRQTLSVSGFSFVEGRFTGSQSFMDADGITRHGVCRFTFTLDQ